MIFRFSGCVSALLALTFAACDPPPGGSDATVDAADDASYAPDAPPRDLGPDTARDVARDLGPDTARDVARDLGPDTLRDVANDGCDPGAHVDCFGSAPTCNAGVVTVPVHRPVYYCTNEEAAEAFWGGVCQRLAARLTCEGGRCAPLGPRLAACFSGLGPRSAPAGLLCDGALAGPDAGCDDDTPCLGAPPEPNRAYRCDADAGRCVEAPRRDAPTRPGAACVTDLDCPLGTACALDTGCAWRCAVLADGGLTFPDAAR
ncbi:MAG: hypothetical protein JNK72_22555 [Myxococcales bacterium]|nr:hypothetical protein [Myxococcales bacterium]